MNRAHELGVRVDRAGSLRCRERWHARALGDRPVEAVAGVTVGYRHATAWLAGALIPSGAIGAPLSTFFPGPEGAEPLSAERNKDGVHALNIRAPDNGAMGAKLLTHKGLRL